jgi:hypothetical protein
MSLAGGGISEPPAVLAVGNLARIASASGVITNAGMTTISSSTSLATGIAFTYTPSRTGNILILGKINTGAQASQSETTLQVVCNLYHGTGSTTPTKNSNITGALGFVAQLGGNRLIGQQLAAAATGWFVYGSVDYSYNLTGLSLVARWIDFGILGANVASDAWQGAQYDMAVLEYA